MVEDNKDDKKRWTPFHTFVIAGISNLIGVGVGMILGSYQAPSPGSKAKIFQEQGLPEVIRTYNDGKKDNLYVKDPNRVGDYSIIFSDYLKTIKDPSQRQKTKTQIEQLVGW